jgi:flavin-dependent dehydrogenase
LARLGAARFDFDIVPLGYGWVFPKRNHLSIGVVSMRRGGVNLNETASRYLQALGVDRPIKVERHGYTIPVTPRRGAPARGRVLLAGDAAGFVDPVTGEGITAAIASGQLAARCLVQAKAEAKPAILAYNAAVKQRLLPELRAAQKLAFFLYECPRTRNWLFRRHGTRLNRAMTQVVTGQSTYRALLANPLNYLRLLAPAPAAVAT